MSLISQLLLRHTGILPCAKQSLGGTVNYQDYFDSRPLEKRIHALQSELSWRCDYFLYLKTTFEHGKFAEYFQIKEKHVCLFPAISFRMFIINAMIIGLNRKNLEEFYIKYEGRSIANYNGPHENTYKGDLYKSIYDGKEEPSIEKILEKARCDAEKIRAAMPHPVTFTVRFDVNRMQLEETYPWVSDLYERESDKMMEQLILSGELDDEPGFFIPEKSLDDICKENYMKLHERTGKISINVSVGRSEPFRVGTKEPI